MHDFPSRGPSPSHARSSRNESPRNGAQAQAVTAVTRAGNSRLLVPLLLSTSEVGCTDARNTRSERCIPYNVLLAVAKKGGRAGRERRTKWTAPKIRRRVSLERIERAVEKRGGRILVVLERGRWCCVRACVRTCGHLELASWMFGNALQPRGTARNSDSLSRRALDGDLSSQDRRATRRDVRRGGMEREGRPCACARSLAGTRVLYVRARTRIPMCARTCVREDAAARARAPLRARERASERERERLAGSLEADWWPDRALRPTVAASGRRLTESGNARRRRRGAASTRPPWPDSRLWTIDRSVHPPRRRKIYRKWGLDINLARRCFPLRTNL